MLALHRRVLVFTGLAGLVGGLGTVVVGSSCDVECVPDDRPSIVVRVVEREGSVLRPVTAAAVGWRFRGLDDDGDATTNSLTVPPIDNEAKCLDEACTRWGVGTDEAGHFDIEVTACG